MYSILHALLNTFLIFWLQCELWTITKNSNHWIFHKLTFLWYRIKCSIWNVWIILLQITLDGFMRCPSTLMCAHHSTKGGHVPKGDCIWESRHQIPVDAQSGQRKNIFYYCIKVFLLGCSTILIHKCEMKLHLVQNNHRVVAPSDWWSEYHKIRIFDIVVTYDRGILY